MSRRMDAPETWPPPKRSGDAVTVEPYSGRNTTAADGAPTGIRDHAPGSCHFCHRADDSVEYLAHYGVFYCGCKRAMGVLRIWSLNGVVWGTRPSERCACTDHATEGDL